MVKYVFFFPVKADYRAITFASDIHYLCLIAVHIKEFSLMHAQTGKTLFDDTVPTDVHLHMVCESE